LHPPIDAFLTWSVMQGVLLTHRALVSVVAATKAFIDQISPNIANGESIDQNDAILSYLPLVSVQSGNTLNLLCYAPAGVVWQCCQHQFLHHDASMCHVCFAWKRASRPPSEGSFCCVRRRTSLTVRRRRRCCIWALRSASGVAISRRAMKPLSHRAAPLCQAALQSGGSDSTVPLVRSSCSRGMDQAVGD
jgi:hypothetical protein